MKYIVLIALICMTAAVHANEFEKYWEPQNHHTCNDESSKMIFKEVFGSDVFTTDAFIKTLTNVPAEKWIKYPYDDGKFKVLTRLSASGRCNSVDVYMYITPTTTDHECDICKTYFLYTRVYGESSWECSFGVKLSKEEHQKIITNIFKEDQPK